MSKLEELKVALDAAQITYCASYDAAYEEVIAVQKAADVAFNAARDAAQIIYGAAYEVYQAELCKQTKEETK